MKTTAMGLLAVSMIACGGGEPAKEPAPAATVAVASAAPSASAAPAAAAWTAPEATPENVRRECAPMLAKLVDANGQLGKDPKAVREQITAMSANPPMPKEPFEWCKAQATADLDKMEKSAAAEKDPKENAKKTMQVIARDIVASYERETMDSKGKVATRQICPSAKAVPAKLDPNGAEWTPKDSDWKDAGWECLRFALVAPQTFQYEVKVTGTKFVIYARRAGKEAVELRLKGEVDAAKKMVKVGPDIEEVKK